MSDALPEREVVKGRTNHPARMPHAIRSMKTAMIVQITYQIKVALAQVYLVGCLPSSKDQTRRATKPTRGMEVSKNVISQSPIVMISPGFWGCR